MIERGAKKIYAVDVGKGILDWSLKKHHKVISLEKTKLIEVKGVVESSIKGTDGNTEFFIYCQKKSS